MGNISGKVTVSDKAVMQIASYAARKTDGVTDMTGRTKKSEVARTVTLQSDTAGVYVTNTKAGVLIEIYVACGFGADVLALKTAVGENVKNAFCGTGITVKDVNVHINSVR